MFRLALLLIAVQLVQCMPSVPLGNMPQGMTRVPAYLGAPITNCATLPVYEEWFQPSEKFDVGDCPKAISMFYHDYVKDHNNIKYEYLSSGVKPVHNIPTQRVPLKVGFGSCTVVIAMRNEFKLGELPGETPYRSAGSDVSSFAQLFRILEDVNYRCNELHREPGWHPAGKHSDIA